MLPQLWEQAEVASRWVRQEWFQGVADKDSALLLLEEVYLARNFNYRLADAVSWAGGFTFPVGVCERDSHRLSLSLSIEKMTALVHKNHRWERFNRIRLQYCVPPMYPEYGLLMDLTMGIRVFRSSEFVPNSLSTKGFPPLRGKYLEAHTVVNRLIFDLWKEDLLFLLPKDELVALSGCHFSSASWEPKRGAPKGRPIVDPSGTSHGAINSSQVSSMAESFYNSIIHPTLFDLVLMILSFEDDMRALLGPDFVMSDVILYKNDLKKAFMLLDMRPEDVQYLITELTDEVCAVYHTGLFGLGTLPFAFAVISRVLDACLNVAPVGFEQMKGRVRVYVDDVMGVTLKTHLKSDNDIVHSYCKKLLGPQAIEVKKYEEGRQLVFIGWSVDLESRTVTMSLDNFNKFAFVLFDLDISKKVQVRVLEQVASLGSRYALILREMRTITAAVYRNYSGITNHNCFIEWHNDAIVAVILWRAILIHLRLNNDDFAKPLDSFRVSTPSVLLNFDASLTGVGVILRSMGGCDLTEGELFEGDIVALGSFQYADLPVPIDFGSDSAYQNVSEFIGVVFGLLMLHAMEIQHVGIFLQGDSVSAMRWAETERFRGILSKPAAMVHLRLCLEFGYEVTGVDHVCGTDNELTDRLSRGCPPETLCAEGLCDVSRIWYMSGGEASVISLCNPAKVFGDVASVLSFWKSISSHLASR